MLINVTFLVKKHKTCKRKEWKLGKKKKKNAFNTSLE